MNSSTSTISLWIKGSNHLTIIWCLSNGLQDNNTEALFGTMDRTLQLLGMGFNEQDVSSAIEKLGNLLSSLFSIQGQSFLNKCAFYFVPFFSLFFWIQGCWVVW